MTEDLLDLVASDPERTGEEKETSITMLGTSDEITVTSIKKTIVKSLLDHDYFEARWYLVQNDGETSRVSELDDGGDIDSIYGVCGELPVGCLTVKSSPRSNNHQSSIVNSEQIDPDAFN